MAIAALVACLVINLMQGTSREQRTELIHKAAHFLAAMALMPVLGVWYFSTIPAESRGYVMGGSAAMTLFLGVAVSVSFLIGGYALVALLRRSLYINAATSLLLLALAFMATGGGEFVREGVRKPYTVRRTLYSNSIRPDEIAYLRRVGSITHDPYPIRNAETYPTDQLREGVKVYRFQCSVCHTVEGVNGLRELTQGWSLEQKRLMIAQLQHTKSFMPPFAGTPTELEALVQYLEWLGDDRPDDWPVSEDPQTLRQIKQWLQDAGTASGGKHDDRAAAGG
jgi:mono/diheme cytochrome c family protein